MCSCGLSSACECSGPCLLRVPVLCVLGLCAFVLGVWCACIAFVYIVRPSPVVHALAVHACVVRACASHARVACTCCACPCCACPRCALSCWSCGVLVQRSSSPMLRQPSPAVGHRAALVDVADTTSLVDPGDLAYPYPFSVTYDCSCLPIYMCLQCCTAGPLHAPQCSRMRLRTAMALEVPFNKMVGRFITATAGSYPEPLLTPGFPSGIPVCLTLPQLAHSASTQPFLHSSQHTGACPLPMLSLVAVSANPGPGAPIWVARLGSPASPRLVPVDAVACRAYRDPRGVNAPKSYASGSRRRHS